MTCFTCPAFVPSWHEPAAAAEAPPCVAAAVTLAATAHASATAAISIVRLISPPLDGRFDCCCRRYGRDLDTCETATRRSCDEVASVQTSRLWTTRRTLDSVVWRRLRRVRLHAAASTQALAACGSFVTLLSPWFGDGPRPAGTCPSRPRLFYGATNPIRSYISRSVGAAVARAFSA